MNGFPCNGEEENEESTKYSDLGVFYQDVVRSIAWKSWRQEYSGLKFICMERSRAKA